MQDNQDIFHLVQKTINLSEKLSRNLKCSEVYLSKEKYINIEIEDNSIKNSEIGHEEGISIRVISNQGSVGFAFTNILSQESIEKINRAAIKMMNAGTKDPDFKNLPERFDNYPHVRDLCDKTLKNFKIENSIHLVKDLIDVCKNDELAISQSGGFNSIYSKKYICNSNGIEAFAEESLCNISSNMIVKDEENKETSFGLEWQSERSLKDLNPIRIATVALNNAKRNLNRIKIETMKVPLILTPTGTINLILKPLAAAINAESFQYKRSFLVDKRNELIGSKFLNVEDNGLLDGAAGSSVFDAEGVPCKNKKIIHQGEFLQSGLLHNSYTAGKDSVESTGNAVRNSYSSTPSIGITNFILKNGNSNKDDLISEVKKGIYFDYTGDSPNIATGDFSGLILQGNMIMNGEIKAPLNETMFGINLLDLFKNIEAVSKEYKIYGGYKAPYIKIKDAQIIGANI
ncbi:MAG: TldD/PmbA family protein [Promethearchaeota archaeon]|nr:MAG: TldD/PmbA family protein [Candidatus Lokiarchaeota archaeon]